MAEHEIPSAPVETAVTTPEPMGARPPSLPVLIAEDDPGSRRLLEAALRRWGHDVVATRDGDEAWTALQQPGAPSVAILDWMMPGVDGVEICRRLAAAGSPTPPYVILLTANTRSADIVAGLEAGADDYVGKPFNHEELRARLIVAMRVVELRRKLAERVQELEAAIARVRQLHGLLPICSYCKKIRNDRNYWQRVEDYVSARSEAQFSHGICPECYEQIVGPELRAMRDARADQGGAPSP
jgi:sigma-B regulation protein RsbU (phosphoserine phosphatase)